MSFFDQPQPASDTDAALPTMADIDALAASLDQIDLTLAELDQPRPTPLHAANQPSTKAPGSRY